MWIMRATHLLASLRIGLRDAGSNDTSSCLNDERGLESIILFMDTATTAKQF